MKCLRFENLRAIWAVLVKYPQQRNRSEKFQSASHPWPARFFIRSIDGGFCAVISWNSQLARSGDPQRPQCRRLQPLLCRIWLHCSLLRSLQGAPQVLIQARFLSCPFCKFQKRCLWLLWCIFFHCLVAYWNLVEFMNSMSCNWLFESSDFRLRVVDGGISELMLVFRTVSIWCCDPYMLLRPIVGLKFESHRWTFLT